MAQKGVKISEDLNDAILIEFLRQWDSGLRGREISAVTVLKELEVDERWSHDPPSESTVNNKIRDLRKKLQEEEKTGEGYLNQPWMISDYFNDLSEKEIKTANSRRVKKNFIPVLLDIQRALIQGRSPFPVFSIESIREITHQRTNYWGDDNELRITRRQAGWFSLIAEIYPFPTVAYIFKDGGKWDGHYDLEVDTLPDGIKERLDNGEFEVSWDYHPYGHEIIFQKREVSIMDITNEWHLGFCFRMAILYAERERLNSLIGNDRNGYIDLDAMLSNKIKTLLLRDNEINNNIPDFTDDLLSKDLGLYEITDYLKEKNERRDSDGLTDKNYEGDIVNNLPSNKSGLVLDLNFKSPNNSTLSLHKFLRILLVKVKPFPTIDIPNPNIPYEFPVHCESLKRCSPIQEGVGKNKYQLTPSVLDFLINQIPPEGVKESQLRIKNQTAKKAKFMLQGAVDMVNHMRVCKCKNCLEIFELIERD